MIVILGLADIITAACLIATGLRVDAPRQMVLFFSLYSILKGLFFLKDIGSVMDIFAGTLLFLTLFFQFPQSLLYFAAFLVGLKGLLSLFSFH